MSSSRQPESAVIDLNDDEEQEPDEDLNANPSPGPSAAQDTGGSSVAELIWRKFEMLEDGTAKCRGASCKQILKASNTTGIKRHLEKKHKKEYISFMKEKDKLKKLREDKVKKPNSSDMSCSTNRVEDAGVKKLKQAKFAWKIEDKALQKRFQNALVEYAADSFSSFRQLSSDSFKNLIQIVNPNVKVMSRQALSTYVKKAAEDVLKQVIRKIKDEKKYLTGVAFTTDMWTARTGDSFMSLTVHYVDRNFVLQRWTAHVLYFPEAHSGKMIKIALDKMIEEIGLDDAGITLYAVNDSAANAKKVGKLKGVNLKCIIAQFCLPVILRLGHPIFKILVFTSHGGIMGGRHKNFED